MYLSPVIYPADAAAAARTSSLLALNPMSGSSTRFRSAILGTPWHLAVAGDLRRPRRWPCSSSASSTSAGPSAASPTSSDPDARPATPPRRSERRPTDHEPTRDHRRRPRASRYRLGAQSTADGLVPRGAGRRADVAAPAAPRAGRGRADEAEDVLGAEGRLVRGPARRGGRDHRPQRRRQAHAAEDPQPDHRADRRARPAPRPGRRRCWRSAPASTPS